MKKVTFRAIGGITGMDGSGAGLMLLIMSCLCFIFILNKLWLSPVRFQQRMRAQGIRGPSYKIFYGNTREIYKMRKEAFDESMEISHNIFPRIQPHIYAWIKVYGKNYLQWHGTQPQMIVTDPDMIREIQMNKNGLFPKPKIREYTRKLLGDGLVTVVNEKKWSKVRRIADQTFHGVSQARMFTDMVEGTEEMLRKWEKYESTEIDVFEEFMVLTSEGISRTAFGSSYMEGQRLFEMLVKLAELAARVSFKIKIPVISKLIKDKDEVEAEELKKGIHDLIIELIRSREKNFGDDFLGQLIKAYHDPDKNNMISLDELVDECKTFYVAGHETSNTSLAFVMLMLAIHKDWQEESRKEVFQIFGKERPSSEGIKKLKTLTTIIRETFRLYPPVTALQRNTAKEVKLGNLVLPPNTNLYTSTLAQHHDPLVWGEDVHLFKPERFAEGVSKATNNNITAFVPFGLGPRTCVGRHYAMTQIKISLSMILQRFRFTLSPNYVHSPNVVITIKPKYGVQLIIEQIK